MSRADTIVLIERFFHALNRADTETVLGCLHEDVVHDTPDGREIGRNSYRHYLGKRLAVGSEEIGDIVVMATDDGTRAAAEFTRRGRRRSATDEAGSGQSYSVAEGMFFTVEDGLILRVALSGARQRSKNA